MVSSRLCVVTNRFRKDDGGDDAWVKVVDAVKSILELKRVHVVVFCGSPGRVQASKYSHVTVTDNPNVLLNRLKKVERRAAKTKGKGKKPKEEKKK